MHISSRTPEGEPGACPVCGPIVVVDVSEPLRDAVCSACGTLLFIVQASGGVHCYPPDSAAAAVARRIVEILMENEVRDADALDSLDAVELQMDFEDAFEMTIDSDEVNDLKTPADFVDYIVRRLNDLH